MSSVNTKRTFMLHQAWHFLGKPYIWGGDDPIKGFDCSGFIVELLQSVGKLPLGSDYSAQGLWDRFQDHKIDNPHGGYLVFYHDGNGSIIHVELCLTDEEKIGASGGGSTVLTEQDAIDKNAYIKIRPIKSKSNIAGYIDVFKE
jgi:cell wall-associated NlpC family hydrolase